MRQSVRFQRLLGIVIVLCTIAGGGLSAACPNPPVFSWINNFYNPHCPGPNAMAYTYAMADEGTNQWQVSVDGGTTWANITNATSGVLYLYTLTSGMNGNKYRNVVTSSCGTSISTPVTLVVTQAPTITSAPSNVSGCPGGSASFYASATSTPAATLQWQQSVDGGVNWFPLTGATTSPLTVSNLTACMDGYRYRAVYTNSCTFTNSAAAVLSVGTAPAIACLGNPAGLSVCPGGNASFTAAATGSPSTLQWQHLPPSGAWTDIAGATSSPLAFIGVSTSLDGYQYRAVFTNSCGSASTTAATLAVGEPPTVTLDPVSPATLCPGGSASFQAAASGSPAPAMEWWVNTGSGWTQVPCAVTSPLVVPNVTSAMDGWQYRAVFTNGCGTVTSAAATMNVNTPVVITDQPDNIIPAICIGTTVNFTAAATGSPAPTVVWQWHANPSALVWNTMAAETAPTLTLTNVTHAMHQRYYRAVFTNDCGSVATAPARLNVLPLALVTFNPPSNAPVCPGSSVNFAASANSDISMLWQVNTGSGWNTYAAGGTSSPMTLSNVTAAMNGNQYRAVFTNICGETTNGLPATLVVYTPPVVTNPVSLAVCRDADATFTASATGSPAPTVQWEKSVNGGGSWSAVSGANTTSLALTAVGMSMSGDQYRAVFTNICGATVATAPATLTVTASIAITAQPAAAIAIAPGGSAQFNVTATPTGLSYQWYRGTTPVGTNSPSLTISNATAAHAGSYRVVISGTCPNSTVTSNWSVLTVSGTRRGDNPPRKPVVGNGGRTGEGIGLGPVRPNPFSGETSIRYSVATPAGVWLRVFNAEGIAVRTLFDGPSTAGTFDLLWNGLDDAGTPVPSGTYFVRIGTASGATLTGQVILQR